MYKLTNEQVEKAVNWWAERLQQPSFDAGADSEEMKVAEVMAHMLTTSESVDSIEKFKKELRKRLKNKNYNPYWGLHVDYHPDLELSESAEVAGINTNNFPWKTNMWFKDDGSVSVALGYGATPEEI